MTVLLVNVYRIVRRFEPWSMDHAMDHGPWLRIVVDVLAGASLTGGADNGAPNLPSQASDSCSSDEIISSGSEDGSLSNCMNAAMWSIFVGCHER